MAVVKDSVFNLGVLKYVACFQGSHRSGKVGDINNLSCQEKSVNFERGP